MTPDEVELWATRLAAARSEGVCCEPISSGVELGIEDAYAIQQALTAKRLEHGQKVVGWKLGYTSLAMRSQMGVSEPNFGPLTNTMIVESGAMLSARLMQPRVEPEIGLCFRRSLRGEVSIAEVIAASSEAFACLEVVDSVFRDYRFTLEDNTADGSSAAFVIVGPGLAGLQKLEEISVSFRRNGLEVATATGSAASGHPAIGVAWLVHQLSLRGEGIRPGDIVITGGLTAAVPFGLGDCVEAVFDGSTHISIGRARRPSPR